MIQVLTGRRIAVAVFALAAAASLAVSASPAAASPEEDTFGLLIAMAEPLDETHAYTETLYTDIPPVGSPLLQVEVPLIPLVEGVDLPELPLGGCRVLATVDGRVQKNRLESSYTEAAFTRGIKGGCGQVQQVFSNVLINDEGTLTATPKVAFARANDPSEALARTSQIVAGYEPPFNYHGPGTVVEIVHRASYRTIDGREVSGCAAYTARKAFGGVQQESRGDFQRTACPY